MKNSTKVLLLFGSLTVVLSLSGLNCGLKKTTTTTTSTPTATSSNLAASNLINADSVSLDASISKNYQTAKSKASLWKPDATLATIQIKLPVDLAANSANETYIFGSAADTSNWWTISIAEQSGNYVRAVIPKEDYLGSSIKPIDTKFWRMNYVKAFQLADKNGGEKFRQDNADTQVTTTLHNTQPKGWLWWEIEYKSASNKLIIKVNPNDGNIVDEQGNPISTGEATASSVTGGGGV